MSFESGTVSTRFFYLQQPMPKNALELLAARMAPPVTDQMIDKIHGWVGGRHLLDRSMDERSAMFGGYLRVTLMQAEKKIPESLLRAECRMEELAHMQASHLAEIDRKTRSEIRKQISARLLPKMPPQLKGISMIHDERNQLILADAMSEKQRDVFQGYFRETFGFNPVMLNPFTAAAHRHHVDLKTLEPTSFSPECEDKEMENNPGHDFLTWIWFYSEVCGGMARIGDHGDFGVVLDGSLNFFMEGSGAHETVLRRGAPLVSAEAKTALLSGKKLRRASIVLARGGEAWHFTVDGDEFAIRGLKLPDGEKIDPVSRFQERIMSITVAREVFLGFYDKFLAERTNPTAWARRRSDIHKWVAERATRR